MTRRTEPDPPDAGEAAALLNASWNDPEWGLLLWLAMLTGLRRGEVSALRWRHFDLERGVMWAQQSNAQPRSGVTEKATKTNQRSKSPSTRTPSLFSERIVSDGNNGART